MATISPRFITTSFLNASRRSALLARSGSHQSTVLNTYRVGSAISIRARRPYSSSAAVEPPEYLSEGELKVFNLLKEGLGPKKLEVQDISGGCGSMYGIDVVSEKFKGLPVIKQHRLVNQILGDEIKKWHGVQLKTKAP